MVAFRFPGPFGKDESYLEMMIKNEIMAIKTLIDGETEVVKETIETVHEIGQPSSHKRRHPHTHIPHHTAHAAPGVLGTQAPKPIQKPLSKLTAKSSEKELVKDPRIRAMLEVLAFTEATGDDYGKIVNGTVISSPNFPDLVGQQDVSVKDLSKHPDILVQVKKGLNSNAAGRYQFMKNTWDEMKRELKLPDFSAKNQDLAAVKLMKWRNMIQPLLNGEIEKAVHNGAPEWASLPKKGGGSYYGGQTARSLTEIKAKYQEALKQLRSADQAPK